MCGLREWVKGQYYPLKPVQKAVSEYDAVLVKKRGKAPLDGKIVRYSHYLEPIPPNKKLAGYSRIWGDAKADIQAECCKLIVGSMLGAGFSEMDAAAALCIARVESGFNPDAAAGDTSASGLFQFIDSTGTVLAVRGGLALYDRFSAEHHARIFPYLFREAKKAVMRKFGTWAETPTAYSWVYAYHHDGPSFRYGGQAIGVQAMQFLDAAFQAVNS